MNLVINFYGKKFILQIETVLEILSFFYKYK